MAGYSSKREDNYEIKYLRKMLGQVDKRIQVPQSLDASSLRSLIDNIEPATPRDTVRHRPRWLSLQSGIAYAAAFALVVALFYSMEVYKPDIISGGMRIAETAQAAPDITVADIPEENNQQESNHIALVEDAVTDTPAQNPESQPLATAISEEAPEQTPPPAALGIGGSGKSVLAYENEQHEYRWRVNDVNDPDKTGPITLEIISRENQELTSQVDIIDMTDIQRCIVLNDMFLLVGSGGNGTTVQAYYDPSHPVEQLTLPQPGTLVDARLYKDVAHIVTLSDKAPEGAETIPLPHSDSTQTCVITAVNLTTLETSQKAFVGAKGTVQLHNLNAYIHFEGKADNGSTEDYIGQILLDGMEIGLGTVS